MNHNEAPLTYKPCEMCGSDTNVRLYRSKEKNQWTIPMCKECIEKNGADFKDKITHMKGEKGSQSKLDLFS